MPRKYQYYQVAVSDGPYEDYSSYQEAFAVYQNSRKSCKHATLWGVDKMGDLTCIMSF